MISCKKITLYYLLVFFSVSLSAQFQRTEFEDDLPLPEKIFAYNIDEIDIIPYIKGCEKCLNNEERLICTKLSFLKKATFEIEYMDILYHDIVNMDRRVIPNSTPRIVKSFFTFRVDSIGRTYLKSESLTRKYWGFAFTSLSEIKKEKWVPAVKDNQNVPTIMELEISTQYPIPYYITAEYFSRSNTNKKHLVDTNIVYSLVEYLPYPIFNGCDETSSYSKYGCIGMNLAKYRNSKLNNIKELRKKRIEGNILVAFTIEIDGTLSNIELVNGMGKKYDDEAIKVLQQMNKDGLKWQPGVQNNQKVKVRLNYSIYSYSR